MNYSNNQKTAVERRHESDTQVYFMMVITLGRGRRPAIFSSEPPRNPRPSNIIFLKCSILQDKTICLRIGFTLEHKRNIKFLEIE